MENHPNFYIREEKELKNLDENGIVKAWIYFIKSFKKELLESEMYENYSSTGPHNLKYVARYLRTKPIDLKMFLDSK